MDLSLSPDLEAYWCYLILTSLALIVAAIQVRALLKGFINAWSTARAWLLLGAYTAVPIALFWLLDRADAVHDTSLFAAILIAITYRQILSGGDQSATVPSGFAKAWKPFVTWSDNIAAGIRDRIARNASRYDAKVIEKLATDATFEEVRGIVLSRSAVPAQTQSVLDGFDRLKPPLDDSGVMQKKATYLYYALKALPDIDSDRFLKDKKIIATSDYYLYSREWRSSIFVALFAVVMLALAVLLTGDVNQPKYAAQYYLWRFEKPHATDADRFRAQQHLERGMKGGNTEFVQVVNQELTARLRFAGLPLETADRILQLLFQNARHASDASLIALLANSLRNENSDLRVRIQRVLVYLADERNLAIPSALRAWKPSNEDAATCIDTVANTWNQLAQSGAVPGTLASLACISAPQLADKRMEGR